MNVKIASDRQTMIAVIQKTLDETKRQGATQAAVYLNTGAGFTVTARLGEVEKVEHEHDRALGVTVFFGRRKGHASSSDFADTAIRKMVIVACELARYAGEDEYAGLADSELMASEVPDLDLHHPWEITLDDALRLAIDCESRARGFDARITNSDGTVVGTYNGDHFYGNTHGFIGGWPWSSHSVDCTVIAETPRGMQRDGWYSKACNANRLQPIEDIAQEAAERTVRRLDTRSLSTRRCPVIFEAPMATGLFSTFITAISGGSLYRQASFLLDALDKQIFSDHIHIHERPHIKGGLGSAPFDDDGLATRERDLVVDGVLRGYVLSSYAARRLGMHPTANAGGVHNLIVDTGDFDLTALLNSMDTGLLVTDVIGFGVNQITGDYSQGVTGFWVERGEIQYPVEEITIAGNLSNMYQRIIGVGNDVDQRGNILTGSVLIEEMVVAGQ